MSVSEFGHLPDGRLVRRYRLRGPDGMAVVTSEFGAAVTSVLTRDRHGALADIVLGHDDLSGYVGHSANPWFGSTLGRCANRIANARFVLDGRTHRLDPNDGPHHLHGGNQGFDQKLWKGIPVQEGDSVGVTFRCHSPDGEQGYPGALDAGVTYILTRAGALHIRYRATTDRPTHVNLSHHSYWVLSGDPRRHILDQRLAIHARRMVPVGEGLVPEGAPVAVADGPFDFMRPRRIGSGIDAPDAQIALAGGYDHTWLLEGGASALKPAARLQDPDSGRVLEVDCTAPGLHFYSGNMLDGRIAGKGGLPCLRRHALCLEPQHPPDTPNRPDLGTTRLDPGQTFTSETVFRFGLAE